MFASTVALYDVIDVIVSDALSMWKYKCKDICLTTGLKNRNQDWGAVSCGGKLPGKTEIISTNNRTVQIIA